MLKPKKQKIINSGNKKEILWNLINSGLAGVLVLLGALTSGELSAKTFCVALVTALTVAVSQFKDYWKSEEKEYKCKTYGFMKLV